MARSSTVTKLIFCSGPPPGSKVAVHPHLDIGQGEVNWDVFFDTLAEVGFDGIMTACAFA